MKTIYWMYELYSKSGELLYCGYTGAWSSDLQMTFKHYAKRKNFWNEVDKIIIFKEELETELDSKRLFNKGKYNKK